MPFASNATYIAPVTSPDLGNPTKVVPPNVANGFVPGTPIPAEYVNYLINKLCPLKQKFTGGGTWVKPLGATIVRIVCVGGGGKGGTGTANTGAKGGDAGEIIEMSFDADELGSSLDVVVGAGSTSAGTGGGATYVQSGGLTLICALGGATGDGFGATGAPSDLAASTFLTTSGGLGGSGIAGNRGNHSRYGAGGAGGAVNATGSGGRGFGAGGGGGRQASGTTAGGGGGGGGYGAAGYTGAASGSTGGNGAPGVCYIFTDVDIV